MTTDPAEANDLISGDLNRVRAIERLLHNTATPSKDPSNPNSASLRYAADVLHGCVGEIEASEAGVPTDDAVAQCIEQLRYDADRMDAEELARVQYPHLSPAEQAPIAETFLATILARRAELGEGD